ncbi:YeiH family protein [Ferruginivarius sediminum]|uniref:Putative sulfate exporter family transporter n=1 Tax=Ferruginivarius sediminum TaxID=2661937 RepID=A0A369T9I3_9PROT|nr:putative sulfate exporter family transporter [Ferruginivarius sediminum]RDD61973.1 putative sulfate exporter family transporter [Ferruginivarius sediminum]
MEKLRVLLACGAVALAGWWFAGHIPLLAPPVTAIGIGFIAINAVGWLRQTLPAGELSYLARIALQTAIVLMGASLDLNELWRAAAASIEVIVVTLTVGLAAALVLGRALGVAWRLRALIGAGTVICGGSAIAAVAPAIRARADDIALSVSIIFLFNVIAVLIFPAVGNFMAFSDQAFGLWAGTAINDTSAVVAAGYAFSDAAGDYATIVKLARSTFILPLVLAFAAGNALMSNDDEADRAAQSGVRGRLAGWVRAVPIFIVLFVAASALNTAGALGTLIPQLADQASGWLMLLALAALGMQTDLRSMARTAGPPLVLGLATWAVVAVTSLLVQALTGQI